MAKQTATLPAPPGTRYEMPIPKSGMVIWRQADGSGEKCAGIITKVNQNSIDVMIFPSGVHLPQPKSGCKHVSDPGLRKMAQPNPGGVWEFTQMEQQVRHLVGLDNE